MNKIKTLIACGLLLLVSNTVFAQASVTIGVVDLPQALFNTDAWARVQEEMAAEFKSDQEAADALNNELKEMQDKANRDASTMSAAEIQRLQNDAQVKQLQLQQIGERVQNAAQSRQNEFIETNREQLSDSLQKVIASGGYDIILNATSVPHYDDVYNVTAKVTAILNETLQ